MDNHTQRSSSSAYAGDADPEPSQPLRSGPGNGENPHRPENTARWVKIATIFAAALILAAVMLQFLSLTAQSIALLFIAIVLGEAISPLVTFMAKAMPRGVAVGLIFLAFVGSVAGIGYYLAPQITQQTTEFIEQLPDFIDKASEAVEDATEVVDEAPVDSTGDDVWAGIQNSFGNLTTTLASVPILIFESIAQFAIMTFMAVYWTISRRSVREFIESLAPDSAKENVRAVLVELSRTVGGYVRGTGIGAIAVGGTVFIGLSIMGVNYPLILAIFAAFGELIPILGPNLAAIPAIIIAFMDSWQLALAVVIFYIVLQQVESNVLVPIIMKNQADIPPLLVIVAVSFGGAIAGILGAIIAIPAAGALRVILVRVVAPAIRRWTGAPADVQAET